MNEEQLIEILRTIGYGQNAIDEAGRLCERLVFLETRGRYRALLAQLRRVNNRANFDALVLEANFAYQFESQGQELIYEVQQNSEHSSSIDFRRTLPALGDIYFELRLVQQARDIATEIAQQLREFGCYRLAKGGAFDQQEIFRIQGIILRKVQDEDGVPTKFFSTAPGVVNIVTVDATQAILGMIDLYDCVLIANGDAGVPEPFRRQVFGLFQEVRPEYPPRIHDQARRFEHVRNTLHGLLFLFKEPHTGEIAYRLRQCMVWNPALAGPEIARPIFRDMCEFIPAQRKRDEG